MEPKGLLHRLRLVHAFYQWMGIIFQIVAVLATAMLRHENQEAVLKQMRKLSELIFPEDAKRRDHQEKSMRSALQREGAKSYKVKKLQIGERDQQRGK